MVECLFELRLFHSHLLLALTTLLLNARQLNDDLVGILRPVPHHGLPVPRLVRGVGLPFSITILILALEPYLISQ